jgi:two-component system response regulator AtoC
MQGSILVVDDEEVLARHLARALQASGYKAVTAQSAAEARRKMREADPDLVLMDLRLPDADGAELIGQLKSEHPETQFIVITAFGSIRSAIDATRLGVHDYLVKPFEPEELLISVRNAMAERRLTAEVRHLRARQGSGATGCARLQEAARSPAMAQVLSLARRSARQSGTVLLLGESGSGKNCLARWIHAQSNRAGGPFLAINCAALPRELAESELFGHEPGAFTGSRGRKHGLLELANEGTLVLDEIGEMDLQLQSKLLTVLDSRTFVRLGGEEAVTADARLLVCTNQDLEAGIRTGRFREDLYYRLNVFPICMPRLRERREDIPILVEHLLTELAAEMGLAKMPEVEPGVVDDLAAASWPGNIRELRNVLERAMMLSDGRAVRRASLTLRRDDDGWAVRVPFPEGQSLHEVTADIARRLIREALRRGQTKQEAARLLGISRHALAHQMRSLELDE